MQLIKLSKSLALLTIAIKNNKVKVVVVILFKQLEIYSNLNISKNI